jgi:hypothetical protein
LPDPRALVIDRVRDVLSAYASACAPRRVDGDLVGGPVPAVGRCPSTESSPSTSPGVILSGECGAGLTLWDERRLAARTLVGLSSTQNSGFATHHRSSWLPRKRVVMRDFRVSEETIVRRGRGVE